VPCSLPSWSRLCGSAEDLSRLDRGLKLVFVKGTILAGRLLLRAMRFMSDKCFVDTNILVYAHDRSTGEKHLRARTLIDQLWDSGLGVLSTQVLQEFCYNIRRKAANPLPVDEVRLLLRDYSTWEVVTNTSSSILGALEIEARYKTSFWHALILQAAETSGATTLYSEDLAKGQRYGTIRVVNPLI
jgi:predicted nucleic acid-binding protein